MRVCLDCRAIRPGGTGIGAYARSAVCALAADPGRHEFLAIGHGDVLQGLTLPPAFSSLAVNGVSPLWDQVRLPQILQDRDVHVHFSPLFTCPVVRSARYVVTIHDVFPESHPSLCPPDYLAFWRHRVGPSLRSACHAVAVSEWSKSQAVSRLGVPPDRVSVVHQCVGEQFRPMSARGAAPVLAKHELAWRGYVLYVGAIDPRKNLPVLVEAFGQMRAEDLLLVVVGKATFPGYDLSGVISKCGLGPSVRCIGYAPDDELPALYAGARCFAFPSLAEGFGRPCVEAMAAGVPVVASNRAALPETCGDAALLPDAQDAAAVAQALAAACFDQGRRDELVRAGLGRARELPPARFARELLGAFHAAHDGPREGLCHGSP